MKYNTALKDLSPHKKQFKTEKMAVPSILFASDEIMPPDETLSRIESVATSDVLFRHTVAMSDVSSKPGRKNASGTTIVSENYLLPQVNDSDPNCGMRLVKTDLHQQGLSKTEIKNLFHELVRAVPTKKYIGTQVPFDVIVDICARGTTAVIEHLNIKTRNEIENSMSQGNFFGEKKTRREIFDAIPKLFLHAAKYRLGIIGSAGNHFCDLMKVTDIIDDETAFKLGITRGQYLFMIHTGSGILGQYTMYMYTAKKREHFSQSAMMKLGQMTFQSQLKKVYDNMWREIKEHMKKEDLLTYVADSLEGNLYMTARDAASNFGTANRATITHNISETCKRILGKDPHMDLLYDLPHIYIGKERHYKKDVWVHRNNTSRAYGPLRMQSHPLFKFTGEPVFIPSSMSTPAYIGVGTDDNEESFFSSPHGAGKARSATQGLVPQNRKELFAKMEQKGVHLYNARSSKVIEQDASQYKNIDAVIKGVQANKVAKIVAKMEPVAVIMY